VLRERWDSPVAIGSAAGGRGLAVEQGLAVDQDGEPVDFLDAVIGDGNAADGSAIAVKKNVAAGILVRAEDAVGSVGITDVHAEVEIALWVEPVEFVKAFGDSLVAEAALGSENAGGSADGIFVDEDIGLVFGGGGPEFEDGFFFEGAKQNGVRRVGKAFFLEALAKNRVFFGRSSADARVFPLEVAEGFGLVGGRGERGEKEKGEGEDGLHGQREEKNLTQRAPRTQRSQSRAQKKI